MAGVKKLRGAFGIVTAVSAGTAAFSGLKAAREDGDKLVLANAVASAGVALTSVLIAVRALRKGGKK